MDTLLKWGGLAFSLALTFGFVVLYIRRLASKQASLETAVATVQADGSRVAAMEEAAAQAREGRAEELDAKIAAVKSADDAAKLLRDVIGSGRTGAPGVQGPKD
jgi:hypothetical protein